MSREKQIEMRIMYAKVWVRMSALFHCYYTVLL